MIEKYSLRIFWLFMLLCAGTMLLNIWATPEPTEFGMRVAGTFFILGLASFLIWGPLLISRFYKNVAVKR